MTITPRYIDGKKLLKNNNNKPYTAPSNFLSDHAHIP